MLAPLSLGANECFHIGCTLCESTVRTPAAVGHLAMANAASSLPATVLQLLLPPVLVFCQNEWEHARQARLWWQVKTAAAAVVMAKHLRRQEKCRNLCAIHTIYVLVF